MDEGTSEGRNSESREPGPDAGQLVRAVVEYDGTQYFGFQIQANAATIQGGLEAALRRLAALRFGSSGVAARMREFMLRDRSSVSGSHGRILWMICFGR